MTTRTRRSVSSMALAAGLLLAVSLACAEGTQGQSGYQNSWYRVAAGGNVVAIGSGYEIVGTIGQWETLSPAFVSGGGFAIRSGFWAAAVQPLPDELFRDRFESPNPVQAVDRRQRQTH